LYYPYGIAVDSRTHDIYFAEFSLGDVRRIAGGVPTGKVSLFAGSGGSSSYVNCGGSAPYGDGGKAVDAYLCEPQAISIDNSADPVNVFISENDRCDMREVVGSSGDIYQVAGSYTLGCGFKDDVVATSGQLAYPWQSYVSVSGSTTTVTVSDLSNCRIRQYALTYTGSVPKPGIIKTIAGNGTCSYSGDAGSAQDAGFEPVGLGVDRSGNIYIGDWPNDRVRKVTKSTNQISTYAGWGNTNYSLPTGILNDVGGQPALYLPYIVYADPASSNIYIGGYYGQADYVWNSATKELSNVAGNGTAGFSGDGASAIGVTAELNYPLGIAKDAKGNLYIADDNNCAIREVEASSGIITTIAGGSEGHLNGCGYSGDGNTAVNAQFNHPQDLKIDSAGNIYIADFYNCAIRKINTSNIVSTVIGGVQCGYSGDDGPASRAVISNPETIALDAANNLYIADYNNQRIREIVAQTGNIITVAGNGFRGYTGDGTATVNMLNAPTGVASDPNGNLFIADDNNQLLRWVTPSDQMITFAGTPDSAGYSGDGGSALKAQFYYPNGITVDNQGNIYTADYSNNVIRKISAFAGYGLSTANIAFGPQTPGTTSDFQPITVSAIGPIDIGAIQVSAGFTEIDNCANSSLTTWQTCEIDVYFQPTAAGKTKGTLTIASNAFFQNQTNPNSDQPSTVALTGTGQGLTLSGSLAFGDVPLKNPVTATLSLNNNGPALSLSKIYLTSTTAFSIASGGTCPLTGGTLGANGSCTLHVAFNPPAVGGDKSTLVVESSDPASPLLEEATGTGTEVKTSTSSINFGTIKHGTTSTVDLTVSNIGTASFTLAVSISGTGFSIASSGKTCGSSVAAGASCVLPIEYAPTAIGTSSGSLTLTTSGGANPTIPLSGTAD